MSRNDCYLEPEREEDLKREQEGIDADEAEIEDNTCESCFDIGIGLYERLEQNSMCMCCYTEAHPGKEHTEECYG